MTSTIPSYTVTLGGNDIIIQGTRLKTSETAPNFSLVTTDLSDVSLSSYAGKRKILNIVPSLDTPTCQVSTRKFNSEASQLNNTVVLVISADLPFAMQRFCTTEGLQNVVSLSLMRGTPTFMQDYGVKIASGPLAGLTSRAVIVLDEHDNVLHAEYVAEIKDEPDYASALASLR